MLLIIVQTQFTGTWKLYKLNETYNTAALIKLLLRITARRITSM